MKINQIKKPLKHDNKIKWLETHYLRKEINIFHFRDPNAFLTEFDLGF